MPFSAFNDVELVLSNFIQKCTKTKNIFDVISRKWHILDLLKGCIAS